MPDITVTITDIEKKSLDYICVGISTFTDNWLQIVQGKQRKKLLH